MKKIIFIALHWLLNTILEIIVRIGRPIVLALLHHYHYTSSITVPKALTKHSILIHASSVGEINAVAPLIKELVLLGQAITINTITVTGREQAKRLFPEIQIEIAPLDIYSLRIKQMKEYQPKMIVIVETEIWPNMLMLALKMRIPVIFVNARMSDKSLARYLKVKPYLSYLSGSIYSVLAQSVEDASRFSKLLGCKAINTGNLKFAIALPDYNIEEERIKLNIPKDSFVICLGSSRPGEEELLISILPELKAKIPNLFVIIAPRHPKRNTEVLSLLHSYQAQSLSSFDADKTYEILLIDTLGVLAKCYAICDIAIVGGSFYDFGGHNPLEPAFYAKPIIFGKHFKSCKDSIAALQQNDAVIISEQSSLFTNLISMYQHPETRLEMGKRAKHVLTENAQALPITIREIRKCVG